MEYYKKFNPSSHRPRDRLGREYKERRGNLHKLSAQIKNAYPNIFPIIATFTPYKRRMELDRQYYSKTYVDYLTMLSDGKLAPEWLLRSLWNNYEWKGYSAADRRRLNLRCIRLDFNNHHKHPRGVGGNNMFKNQTLLFRGHHAIFDWLIGQQLANRGVANIENHFPPELVLTPLLPEGKYFYEYKESQEILHLFRKQYENYCNNMGIANAIDYKTILKEEKS